MVFGRALFSQHRDVVVRAVHARPHQIGHAGVDADVLFVSALVVYRLGDEVAIRSGDTAAVFHENLQRMQLGRHDDFPIRLLDPAADQAEVDRFLAGSVGDADAAAEVDEFDSHARVTAEFHRQFKQHFRRLDEELGIQLVRGHHGVQPEAAHPLRLQLPIAVHQLLAREAVLRFFRLADDGVPLAQRPRVVAQANHFRQSHLLFQIRDVGDVIEVDDRTQLPGTAVLFRRRLVRGEHDVLAGGSDPLAEHQFRQAGAVPAQTFLPQDLQQVRIRGGFDRKILLELGPGEGLDQPAGAGADRGFVIDVKRRRVIANDLADGPLIKRKWLVGHDGLYVQDAFLWKTACRGRECTSPRQIVAIRHRPSKMRPI